jgi:hypothetical protein
MKADLLFYSSPTIFFLGNNCSQQLYAIVVVEKGGRVDLVQQQFSEVFLRKKIYPPEGGKKTIPHTHQFF